MPDIVKKKIVIVENEEIFSAPLMERLGAEGYDVKLATDPGGAIATIASMHPDIAIIDVGMHEVDGFAILETLRSNSDTLVAQTPVVIASNTGDLMEISRALRFGIKDYFVKSGFDVELVVSKIRNKIGGQIPTAPTGAVVSTQIPIVTKDETPPPTSIEIASATKLLIIEDDKFLRDLAIQKISKEGLTVVAAMDGEQGVAVAEKELPNIILLDILLPGIDGFEVLKRLRANPVFAKTYIAMLSNFGQREDIERALTSGADQFLVKANYTLDEIVQEVKKIVATPRAVPPAS